MEMKSKLFIEPIHLEILRASALWLKEEKKCEEMKKFIFRDEKLSERKEKRREILKEEKSRRRINMMKRKFTFSLLNLNWSRNFLLTFQ